MNGTGATLNIGLQTSSTANQTPANSTTVNVAALSSFTTNITNFNVGFAQESGATLILSDTSNDITATTLTIANSNGNNGVDSTLQLGAGTNLLKVTTLNIGISKVAGILKFASQAPNSAGTVSITGKTGGSSTANITIGSKGGTSTAANFNALLDLRGHDSTVQAGTVVVGQDTSTGSTNAAAGTINFDTGSFTVTSLTLGNKTSSASATAAGTLNVSGGLFTIATGGTFKLANRSGSAGTALGTVSLTGGSIVSNVDMTDGGQTNATSSFTLDGGTLDMKGHNIGASAALIDTLALQSGSLQNVAQINNGAGLTKTAGTTSNTLILSGTNTYTGGTTINAGTLLANTPSPNSSTGAGTVTVNNTGVLGGTGNIAGAVTVNSGGTVAPGASIGTLSIASPLTLAASGVNGAATMVTELKADGTKDVLALTGANAAGLLTIGTGDTLNLMPLDSISTQTSYTIATFSSLSGTFANVLVNGQPTQNTDSGQPNYVSISYAPGDGATAGSGNIQISVNNLTGVPEPAFMGLMGMAGIGLLARRRRRQG
jgi:autotransporter-associated beta strand protein